MFPTKKELDHYDEIFDIHRKKGIKIQKIEGSKAVLEMDPALKKSTAKYAGAILIPEERCIDLFDFTQRILKKAKEIGVRVSTSCSYENFVF